MNDTKWFNFSSTVSRGLDYQKDVHKSWREKQEELDKKTKQFHKDLSYFPNLFKYRQSLLSCQDKFPVLLHKLQQELDGNFSYRIEIVRIQNLIIFLHFMMGNKHLAMERYEEWMDKGEINIITLINLSVLQWEMNRKSESKSTLARLQDLYKLPDYCDILDTAEAEIGFALIRFGPTFFINAVDHLRKAVRTNLDPQHIYVWKYDLALAIRRNFNLYVFKEHPDLSAPQLAQESVQQLNDIIQHCLNNFYKSRGLAELANLVSHLRIFQQFCKETDATQISALCAGFDELDLLEQALEMNTQDFYVLRTCGRLFGYHQKFEEAFSFLFRSKDMNENSEIYQLLGKTILRLYKIKKFSRNKNRVSEVETQDFIPGSQHYFHEGAVSREDVAPDCAANNAQTFQISEISEEQNRVRQELEAQFDAKCLITDNNNYIPNETDHVGNIYKRSSQEGFSIEADANPTTLQPAYDNNLHQPWFGSANPHEQQMSMPKFHSFPSHSMDLTQSRKQHVLRNIMKCQESSHCLSDNDPEIIEAKRFLLKAAELDPTNFYAFNDIGIMYMEMKKPEKAYKYFEHIICQLQNIPLLLLVNAYERCGLCLVQMSEGFRKPDKEKKDLAHRAVNMFMSSLRTCCKASANLPGVEMNRANIWQSYPTVIRLLEREYDMNQFRSRFKLAKAHELVGKYMEANEVYRYVLDLKDSSQQDRSLAVYRLVHNYFCCKDLEEARFILDLFLISDMEKEIMFSADPDLVNLRQLGMNIFISAAERALRSNVAWDARECFQKAWILKKGNGVGFDFGQKASNVPTQDFNVIIFDDCDDAEDEDIYPVQKVLVAVIRDIFGLRVSRNDEAVPGNRLRFEGELNLALSAQTVLIVLPPGKLSSRMSYLVDTALRSEVPAQHVLPCIFAGDELPEPVKHLPLSVLTFPTELCSFFCNTFDVTQHVDLVIRLFRQIADIEDMQQAPSYLSRMNN